MNLILMIRITKNRFDVKCIILMLKDEIKFLSL